MPVPCKLRGLDKWLVMSGLNLKIMLFHPTGNANVRALAEGLVRKGLLANFYTCIALFKDTFFFRMFNLPFLREFYRRSFPSNLKDYTYTRPQKELGRMAAQKLGWTKYLQHEKGKFCIDKVYHDLDLYVSKRLWNVNAVYAFEDGALQSFEIGKLQGIKCLYDLPTVYWRAHEKFLLKEKEDRPEWSATLKCFQDSEAKLNRKDRELLLADVIIVASKFTKETLNYFPGQLAPILIVPYGFPKVYKQRKYTSTRNRKLKLLFVGGLSQAKGLANVLEAVENLGDLVELTIVGRKVVNCCAPLEQQLPGHRYIASLPNTEILSLMRKQDIFIFPSLLEGYGLVITEAMSQGTPVITTDRTCGKDFIRNGENGWLVEAGNSQAIIQTLKEILHEPECISRAGKAAMATAEKLPMETYGERLIDAINKVL